MLKQIDYRNQMREVEHGFYSYRQMSENAVHNFEISMREIYFIVRVGDVYSYSYFFSLDSW